MRSWMVLITLALGCIETGIGASVPSNDPRGEDPAGGVDSEEIADCQVALPDGRELFVDATCLREPWSPPLQPWDVRVKWRATAGDPSMGAQGVAVMPAVGNLTDDNHDGFIDDRDVPDIAYTVLRQDVLEVRSGDDGHLHFQVENVLGTAGVAIADVTGDGRSEVIALRGGHSPSVIAVDRHGELVWQSAGFAELLIYGTPVVADLDGSGDPVVIFDRMVIDGKTGVLRRLLTPNQVARGVSIRSPVVADVDLDGRQDIFLGPDRFVGSGERLWSNAFADPRSVHVAIANVDDDDLGEILMVSGYDLFAFKPDGTQLYRSRLPGDNGGPPCVADFDGDGEVEVGIAVGDAVAVYRLDGTQLWQHPSVDLTLAHAGCSGYDFDGDGAYELLHSDQETFYIFDGATGRVLYRDDRHTSTTIFEYPVVADVDRDGSADIVLASNINDERTGWAGVTVFEHVEQGWARSGATWGVHDFAVTNLGADGSVPVVPTPPWLVHNVFRARPTVDSEALPNLQVEIVEACVGSCDVGPVRLSYVVRNVGGYPVRPGTPLAVYVLDRGERVHHTTVYLPEIPAGTALPGRELLLEPADLRDALLLVVDDDGSGRGRVLECDETDNQAAYERRLCERTDL